MTDRRVRLPRKCYIAPNYAFGGQCQMSPVAIPICAAIAAAFLFGAAPASAQAELPSEWLLCSNEGSSYPPEIVIDGCTAVVRSGDRMPRERAVAYTNRGLAYRRLGNFERAFADYDAAIGLDPSYAP